MSSTPIPDLDNASVGNGFKHTLGHLSSSFFIDLIKKGDSMSKPIACDGQSPFFGCRFSLYPMSDHFVPIILNAIEALKDSGLEVESGHISTCVMGKEKDVFETLKRVFSLAASSEKHVVMSATFSKGCPGEAYVDVKSIQPIHQHHEEGAHTHRKIDGEFSIYPLGHGNYMSAIYDVIDHINDMGIYDGSVHFATRLHGTIHDVFTGLENVFETTTKVASHTVMQVTLSANSPSVKKGEHNHA